MEVLRIEPRSIICNIIILPLNYTPPPPFYLFRASHSHFTQNNLKISLYNKSIIINKIYLRSDSNTYGLLPGKLKLPLSSIPALRL